MKPLFTAGNASLAPPGLLTAAAAAVAGEAQAATALVTLAEQKYQAGETAESGRLFAAALEEGMGDDAVVLYNAACCHALEGDHEAALDYLDRAVAAGFRDLEHQLSDADLAPLHAAEGWPEVVAAITAADRAYLDSVNVELYQLYCEDQADRSGNVTDWRRMAERDERRRQRAREIVDAGALAAADDYYHAAVLFQHGGDTGDYRLSWELASRAAEIEPDHGTAPWLSAAARDRFLWSIDQPQVFGTQFQQAADGSWTLEPIAGDAVSDDQRQALGVPPLALSRGIVAQLNATAAQLDAGAEPTLVSAQEETSSCSPLP